MRVKVVLLRDHRKVMRVLKSCRELTDAKGEVKAKDYWQAGTYVPHPRWVNCYLIVFRPPAGQDALELACRGAEVLEELKGVVMDWCAGRTGGKGEAALLFIKPRAANAVTGKEVRVYITKDDITALAELAGVRRKGK